MTVDKDVIISDPYDSGKEIVLPWDKFDKDLGLLYVSSASPESRKQVQERLPTNYQKTRAKDIEQRLEYKSQLANEDREREKAYKDKVLENNVSDICSGLETLKYGKWGDETSIKNSVDKINKDNVVPVLKKADSQLVLTLDEYRSGWGSGKEKRELIEPIINAISERAAEIGVDKGKIEQFKKTCIDQELNALFYTNGEVLQKEVSEMQKLISKFEPNKK